MMYTTEMALDGMNIHTKFHEDWYRRSSNVRVMYQKCERLQCWHYLCEGFMNCAVEMGSGDMIYVPSSMTIGSGI
jgi:hypothetical protein